MKNQGLRSSRFPPGFQGVRSNPMIGYGIVVGLKGTGDSAASLFANRSLAGLLAKLGIVVDAQAVIVTNVAAVMVTADLPPFSRIGESLDVLVSSIGDSANLQGGTLLATPLLGVDGLRPRACSRAPAPACGPSAGPGRESGARTARPRRGPGGSG